jgi:AcrR family transcriptional regulator
MAVDTKKRILDEARDLFLEEGSQAVTMRVVADRVGLTAMAIYRHFENRDELFRAVVAKGHALFLQYLQVSLQRPTPGERLFESGRAYLRFALENPRDYAVIFMEPMDSAALGELGSPLWQDAATFRFLVERIEECAEAGVVHVPDAEDAALTVWAQVHGLVSLFLANKLQMDAQAFEKLYERSLLRLMSAFSADAPKILPPVRNGKRKRS